MIKKIELFNFMSHPHTVIEPAPGLTVLTGDNNTGKSAVVTALQVLAANTRGDYMVRHGEKYCRVRVETTEGHIVEWKREGRTVSYEIDGRAVHRLGGGVPEDLHSLLKLAPVEAENDTFDIHFGEQKDPIFLLNESPGKRAAFFASSSDTIKLIEMQNLHRRQVQEAKSREKELIKSKAAHETRIALLLPVREMTADLHQIEETYAALTAERTAIDKLSADIDTLTRVRNRHHRLADITAIYAHLEAPPVPTPEAPLEALVKQMTDRSLDFDKNREMKEQTQHLDKPPQIEETASLETFIHRYRRLRGNLSAEDQRLRVLDKLGTPPVLSDDDPIRNLIGAMQKGAVKSGIFTHLVSALDPLAPPPEMTETADLDRLLSRLRNREDTIADMVHDLEQTAQAHAACRRNLRTLIEETRICPYCGQEMDADTFIHHFAVSEGEKT